MNIENRLIAGLALALMLANVGCSGPAKTPESRLEVDRTHAAPPPLTMTLQPGQIVSVVSLDPASGADARLSRQAYLDAALPLASQFGLRPMGALGVAATAVGKFEPSAIAFFMWPSQDAPRALARDPRWPEIKAKRPDGWDELRVHDVVATRPLTLRFDPAKTYTMGTAWINPDRPDDYDRYLNSIEPAVSQVGGRFMLRARDPGFESHAHQGAPPGRVIFVEWDSPDALAALQDTALFKANVNLLQSGTTQFELLVLRHPG